MLRLRNFTIHIQKGLEGVNYMTGADHSVHIVSKRQGPYASWRAQEFILKRFFS